MAELRGAMERNALVLSVLLILAVFWLNFALYAAGGVYVQGDTFSYLVAAKNLVEGSGFTVGGEPEMTFPPGYGLTAMPFYLVGFELVQSGVIANVVLMGLACLFVYLICREFVARSYSLLAVALLVANGKVVFYVTRAMSETAYMAAILGAAYFAVRFSHSGRRGYLAGLGAFCAAAALTRPEGIGIAGLLFGYILILSLFESGRPRISTAFVTRWLVNAAVWAAAFGIVYAPYAWFLSNQIGHFVLTNKTNINILAGNAVLTAPKGVNLMFATDIYINHPALRRPLPAHADLLREVINLQHYLRYALEQSAVPVICVAVTVAGLMVFEYRRRIWFRPNRKAIEAWLLCLFMLCVIVALSYFQAKPRFFSPLNPVVAIAAAVAVSGLLAGMAPRARGRILAVAVTTAVLAGILLNVHFARKPVEEAPSRLAAEALAQLSVPRPISVLTLRRHSMVSYYANHHRVLADARMERLDVLAGPADAARLMKRKGLTYFVVDKAYLQTRPYIGALWTCRDHCPDGFHLVGEVPEMYRIFVIR